MGSLTVPMADVFDRTVGIDVSRSMVVWADDLSRTLPQDIEYIRDDCRDLGRFEDGSFDFVYSGSVLQHIPSRELIAILITELVRVTATGGLLVFQVPSHLPVSRRIQPRRRLFHLLRRLGVPVDLLYGRLGLQPILMNFVPLARVVAAVESAGGQIFATDVEEQFSVTYYATR